MREIKVTVNPDGSTKVETSGFQGKACLEEAERMRQILLGLGILSEQTSFEPKPELRNTLDEGTIQQNQQGVQQ